NSDSAIEDDKTINQFFAPQEIDDLKKILGFFEAQICDDDVESRESLLQCYMDFFTRMDSATVTGYINLNISFDQQQELYTQISNSTFGHVWTFHRSWRGYPPSDTLKKVSFNDRGRYMSFLRELGKHNDFIGKYQTSFEFAGDISPDMVARMLKLYQD